MMEVRRSSGAVEKRSDRGLLDESDDLDADAFMIGSFNDSQEDLLSSRQCSTGRNTAVSSPRPNTHGLSECKGAAARESSAGYRTANDSETEEEAVVGDDTATALALTAAFEEGDCLPEVPGTPTRLSAALAHVKAASAHHEADKARSSTQVLESHLQPQSAEAADISGYDSSGSLTSPEKGCGKSMVALEPHGKRETDNIAKVHEPQSRTDVSLAHALPVTHENEMAKARTPEIEASFQKPESKPSPPVPLAAAAETSGEHEYVLPRANATDGEMEVAPRVPLTEAPEIGERDDLVPLVKSEGQLTAAPSSPLAAGAEIGGREGLLPGADPRNGSLELTPPPASAAVAETGEGEQSVPRVVLEDLLMALSQPPAGGDNGIPVISALRKSHSAEPVLTSRVEVPSEQVCAQDAPQFHNDDRLSDDADVLSQPSQALIDVPPPIPNAVIDNYVDFGDAEDEDDEYGEEIPASFLAEVHSMTQDYRPNESLRSATKPPLVTEKNPKSSQEYYHEDDEITCSFLESVDKHATHARAVQNATMASEGGALGFVAASGKKLAVAPESFKAIRSLADDDFRDAPRVSFVPQSLADLRISSSQRARSREFSLSQGSGSGIRGSRSPGPGLPTITEPLIPKVAPPAADNKRSPSGLTRTEIEDAVELTSPQSSPPLSAKMTKIAVSIVGSPHKTASHEGGAKPHVEDPSPKRARYSTAEFECDRPAQLLPETPLPQQNTPSLADSAIPFSKFAERLKSSTEAVTPVRPPRPPGTSCLLETPVNRGPSTCAGFSTGTGKSLPKISEKTQLYIKRLGFGEGALDLDAELPEAAPDTPLQPCTTPHPPPTSEPDIFSILFDHEPTTPIAKRAPSFAGFSTGAGKALPATSAKARAHARLLGFEHDRADNTFAETPVPKCNTRSANLSTRPPPCAAFETPVSKPAVPFSGFASGNGKQLAPVSEQARTHVRSLGFFESLVPQSPESGQSSLLGETPSRRPSNAFQTPVSKPAPALGGFASGNGKKLPPISQQARAKLQLLGFDDDDAAPSMSRPSFNAYETPVSKPVFGFRGFASGNGQQLPPISQKARTHLKLLGFGEDDDGTLLQPLARDETSENVRSKMASTAQNCANPSASVAEKRAVDENRVSTHKESDPAVEASSCEPPRASVDQEPTTILTSIQRAPPKTPHAQKDGIILKRTPAVKKLSAMGSHCKIFALPGSPTTASPGGPQPQTPAGQASAFSSPMSAQKKMFKPLNICVKLDSSRDAGGRGGGVSHVAPPPKEIAQPKRTHVPLRDVSGNFFAYVGGFTISVIRTYFWLYFSARPKRPLVDCRNRQIQGFEKLHEPDRDILDITALNAGSYVFRQATGDTWGAIEARTQLLQKHVSANLATKQWVNNHYRWIVWQMAGQVRSFPELLSEIWHKDAAFDRLIYHYEREINCAARSAIKKIIERDDIPEWHMVLCISQIAEGLLRDEQSSASSGKDWDLELTDGWYSIKSSVDAPLQAYIRRGKLRVGDKISVCGAQLVGPTEPCPALEATNALRLKLCVNGTHRARWNARLGYQRSRHFTVGLRQVLPAGGAVPCVDVVVCRRYVPRFMEKLPKGGSVFRNQKAEEEASRAWQKEYNKALQKAITAVEAEWVSDNGSPDGAAVAAEYEEELKSTTDVGERVRLKECQKEAVANAVRSALEHRQVQMMDEVNARMETDFPPRDVSKFITFRVCDYPPEGIRAHQTREALLTIWNPDEALASRLQEGKRFKIYNLTASDTARDNCMSLNLKAQRSTKYIERPAAADRVVNSLYVERVYARVDSLVATPSTADVDVLVVALKTSDIREIPQYNMSPRHVVTVLCTDQSKALLVLEVSAGTRETLNFQPFTHLHCHNLQYVYYDRHFNVHKLKETPYSDVARIARTAYEKAQDRVLSDWCRQSFAELRDMVTCNNDLLQDMATYTGAASAEKRERPKSTHSQPPPALEPAGAQPRFGDVYDDDLFGDLSLSLLCDEF
ncbi:Breast cancer 2, early onset [Geranomyces michiganensis]|nr:Breast cancer 2, early onset [Geranomyces michiganensis]